MIYNMILKMINSDVDFDYSSILQKIDTFEKNKRLTQQEAQELCEMLDVKHYQPVVLPE